MLGKTHAAVGAGVALTAVCFLGKGFINVNDLTTVAMAGAAGGIAADIDSKKSMSSTLVAKSVPYCIVAMAGLYYATGGFASNFVTDYIKQVIAASVFAAFIFIGKRSPHREKTHSLLACCVTSLCAACFSKFIACAWFLGYMSHLLIDLLNTKGEQLLWPLNGRWCFNMCKSNGAVNKMLFYVGSIMCFISISYVIGGSI